MSIHPRRHRLVPAVLALLLASGCAGSAEQPSGEGPTTAERLTIAVPAAVGGPLNVFVSFQEQISELVYDKLLAPSPYVGEPQPWLASEVRMVDPSTWEVALRDDVRWHDGEPFTADDVAFTFHYAHEAPTGRFTHHINEIPDVSSVDVLGPHEVRFTCAFPCPDLGPVTLADLPILPEHIWSQVPPAEAKNHDALPVGTGPYRLVEFDPTTGYRFVANPDYFAGAPVVRELVMPIIADPSATFTALRAGQIDAAFRPVSPELIDQFSSSSDVGVIQTRPLRFPELRVNFERAPFDQPRFREALSLALDRQELLDTVYLGQGRVADKGYPHPDSPWTDPTLSTPSEPPRARALLDELGYADGDGDGVREGPAGPLRYTIVTSGVEPTQVRAAEIVAEQLTEVGIAATAQGLDAGSFADLSTSRDFDMQVSSITAHGVADPTQFIMSHRSGYLWDAPELPYPEWDALFERWKATTTVEDRRAVAFEMQRMFNRQPTSIPLYYPDEYWAFRPDAFAGWAESPGFGIVHKWSLLPRDVALQADAIVVPGVVTLLRAVAARVAQYALVLWVAATLNFLLPHLAPGDPVQYLYGGDALGLSPEAVEQVRAGYGLDRPLPEQYLAFWTGLLHGDLGRSVQFNRPVVDVLAEYVPWTVALVGVSTLVALLVGVGLGAWAAWHRGRRRDAGAVAAVLVLDSMPGFWIGMILIAVFAVALGWFPSYGGVAVDAEGAAWLADAVQRTVLPAATLALATFGGFFLLTRAAMVTVLDEPFVRLARAKGAPERRVALHHALRTALLPVWTNVTLVLGTLLSGAVVVETVFAYPGLGRLIFDAVTARDHPLLQGAFLLVTVGIVAANAVADLTYPLLDPRVRPARAAAGAPS